jgi:putative ABC transport system ATP-binding protein
MIDVRKTNNLPKITNDVLKGINLEVAEKDFVAIMGPSGSGKSTLLNITGCLDRPTSGIYLFTGIDIGDKTDNELAELRNNKIGFVFQNYNLLPRLSAWKNVEIPLIYSGVAPKERRQRAMEMLEKVGLLERAEHKPSELSGGEQQRVAIARALINRPAVILADEPTGNLDSRIGIEIIELFGRLNEEGVSIVLVTHENNIAAKAHKVITIKDGVCSSGCY